MLNIEVKIRLLHMLDVIWKEIYFSKKIFKINEIFYSNKRKTRKSDFLILSEQCFSGVLISSLSRIIKQQRDSCSIFKIKDYINSNIKEISKDVDVEKKLRDVVNKIDELKKFDNFDPIIEFRDNSDSHIALKHARNGQRIRLKYNINTIKEFIDFLYLINFELYKVLDSDPPKEKMADYENDLINIINYLDN